MSITIELSAEDERKLEERAKLRGQALQEYVNGLIQRDIRSPTIAEILSRFDGPGAGSDEADEELNDFVESEIKAYRAEKRRARADG